MMIIGVESKHEYQYNIHINSNLPFFAQILLLNVLCDELCGQTLSSDGDVVNHLAWQPDITPNIGLKNVIKLD